MKISMNEHQMLELAQGLQNSNAKEVSELAKAYIIIYEKYKQIHREHVRLVSEMVIDEHSGLMKRLRELGD